MSITQVHKTYVCYQSIDPDRVEAVQALLDALNEFPELRIGQLINNARTSCPITQMHDDEFHIVDKRFAQMLRDYSEKMRKVMTAAKEDENEAERLHSD